VPLADGVLDLLPESFRATGTQKMLDTPATAWAYDRLRDVAVHAIGMPSFASELADVTHALDLRAGDEVIDLACGHGNFTVALARAVGPQGFVIGIDIASSMLARAAARMRRAQLDNVLLVRGDALALPLASDSVVKLNCSGGIHQFPDLGRALDEIARVTRAGALVAVSGFATEGDRETGWRHWLRKRLDLHVVSLPGLARRLESHGFDAIAWRSHGPLFGRASGRRREAR
jgi:ubiquinone/menaquinone biosynthesis C-methylase UbiE